LRQFNRLAAEFVDVLLPAAISERAVPLLFLGKF